jgi:tRNA modification GTPase
VLRVSGPQAAAVAVALTGKKPPPPRMAALRRLRDPVTSDSIDPALLLWFPAPRSATGEDLLEIQHHGGAAVASMLLAALEHVPGCRPAGPGEFTRRAFLNGKLDLTAAEGLADLIDATTRAQARQALRQLDGGLGRLYAGWRERLLAALARVEAEIDFAAEEEVPEAMVAQVLPDLARLRAELAAHLADSSKGERLRAGVTVAVIGAPNVGKSSLVNLLARREVAIVTAIAGTTRDVIEVQLDLDGVPVTVLDTAGLRDTVDPLEAEGVARARRRAAQADLRLHVINAGAPEDVAEGEGTILVANKIDTVREARLPVGAEPISCLTGAGIAELTGLLAARAAALVTADDAPLLTRARHRAAVAEAEAALARFVALAVGGAELALLAEDLRLAARTIGGITGAVGVEAVLDRIFATFCIGK